MVRSGVPRPRQRARRHRQRRRRPARTRVGGTTSRRAWSRGVGRSKRPTPRVPSDYSAAARLFRSDACDAVKALPVWASTSLANAPRMLSFGFVCPLVLLAFAADSFAHRLCATPAFVASCVTSAHRLSALTVTVNDAAPLPLLPALSTAF